jgi:DNA invertase Pin-like site-specific DNA recombinase
MGSNRANTAPCTRPLLPKDLSGALKHLGDNEFDELLAAISAEGKRRGRLEPTQGKAPKLRQTEDASRLTSGQLNAVRAAVKAGVKPSAIARQFRISQSEVRKVLAKVVLQSKSGR